ncbi:hypothetical protein K438DRAFT_1980185 [Mycena galopus ATCC 62051]|nr:hypothetical protein K438DRAFT_1980185 [Mycena galopus ATCC 62051]
MSKKRDLRKSLSARAAIFKHTQSPPRPAAAAAVLVLRAAPLRDVASKVDSRFTGRHSTQEVKMVALTRPQVLLPARSFSFSSSRLHPLWPCMGRSTTWRVGRAIALASAARVRSVEAERRPPSSCARVACAHAAIAACDNISRPPSQHPQFGPPVPPHLPHARARATPRPAGGVGAGVTELLHTALPHSSPRRCHGQPPPRRYACFPRTRAALRPKFPRKDVPEACGRGRALFRCLRFVAPGVEGGVDVMSCRVRMVDEIAPRHGAVHSAEATPLRVEADRSGFVAVGTPYRGALLALALTHMASHRILSLCRIDMPPACRDAASPRRGSGGWALPRPLSLYSSRRGRPSTSINDNLPMLSRVRIEPSSLCRGRTRVAVGRGCAARAEEDLGDGEDGEGGRRRRGR